jgi:hypothetical protein
MPALLLFVEGNPEKTEAQRQQGNEIAEVAYGGLAKAQAAAGLFIDHMRGHD